MQSQPSSFTPVAGARPRLVLGSTSAYRRELMMRLKVPFDVLAPDVDETARDGEAPIDLAQRLAMVKARAVADRLPEAWTDTVIIGSDQVADLGGTALGKPGTHDRAVDQLHRMSGHKVLFHTAVAVLRPSTGFAGAALSTVAVTFRTLGEAEIDFYLRTEEPYDCAGSAKSEALGIALVDAIESDDPTALVGLPLIRTCRLLREAGLDVLQP